MSMASEELIDRAWTAFEDENYDEAEACARRALLIDPDSVEARLAAARSLINKEEYEAAIPLLREAAALEPDDSEARTFLGISLFESCRFREAIAQLRLAVDLGEDSPDASYWLGLAVERTGDYEEADQRFRTAHEIDPEHFPLPVRISREECQKAVEEARGRLPRDYDPVLENVAIRIEPLPDESILTDTRPPLDPCLLGLFVGVPITEKSATGGPPSLPDQIFIFQRNLERSCPGRASLVDELYKTLYHEIGHYLGRDEDELAELGMA